MQLFSPTHLLVVLASTLLLTISPLANASLEDELSNLCTIIKNDDKSQLRKKLSRIEKTYRLKLTKYYAKLGCNNVELLRFAVIHQANDAGVYLTRKLTKSSLSKKGEDGLSLAEWAEANGYNDSPIIVNIVKRTQ